MKTNRAALSLLLAAGALWPAAACRDPAPAPAADAGAAPADAATNRPAGSWWPAREAPAEQPEAGTGEELRKLAALGYLSGYRRAPAASGVVAYDPRRAQPGYNLLVSGHAPHAALMDARGRLLHSWSMAPPPEYGVPPERRFWRRVHLLDDGSLLAIFDPYGIVKLDRDSNLVWATDPALRLHHDLFVAADGTIHVLGKRERKIPHLHERLTFGEDLVVELSPDGTVRRRVSILEAFENSPWKAEIEERIRASAAQAPGDVWEDFHANTLEVLDGSLEHLSPIFSAGNVVSCSPTHSNVFILDPDVPEVVWNWFGPWIRIHEAQVLAGGRLLLFHNNGHQEGVVSQALEYDLLARTPVWSYDGRPEDPGSRFFSGTSSTVERLAGGNTLIVATELGRAIEVTPEGEVVWEFFNPERAGAEGELIASLFQLQRVPRERVDPWLRAARAGRSR